MALVLFLCCQLVFAHIWSTHLWADSWQPLRHSEDLPPRLVAVDKARQTFLLYEKKSPLKLKYRYNCATGQVTGDKQARNDLRTPEGIYFVDYKIAGGLDFKEYGGIAYTLNYPNPVDRLRGKTGYGIWIHSKGFGIEPYSTRGCVAIGLRDIGEVGPDLVPGTAVVLAETLDEQHLSRSDGGSAAHLRRLMHEWSQAWAARSTAMFGYYDAEAYTKAMPESFAAFRLNKERLFKILDFINIYNRKIHVLEGPGYWVTWAEQFYTASNLSTEGIRRLYWQKGKDGAFRIVGMEWTPRNLGMQADFQKGLLVAEARPPQVSDAAAEAPLPPRLDMPEKAGDAAPAGQQQQAADEKLLAAVSDPLVPRSRPVAPPAEVNWGTPPAEGPAGGEPEAPAAPPSPEAAREPVEAAPPAKEPVAEDAPLLLTPEVRAAVESRVRDWDAALARRSPELADFYDRQEYGRHKDAPRGESHAAMWKEMERRFKAPWLHVVSRAPAIEVQNGLAVSSSDMLVALPGRMEQGVVRLWWHKGRDGALRIVAARFQPEDRGLSAEYLDRVSDEVGVMLEAWRKAWEAGHLDGYMGFYTPDIVQQGRRGIAAVRAQKKKLWGKVRPAQVQLSGLRLTVDAGGLRADMGQFYEDSAGHNDRGTKTLLLRHDGGQWRIAREEWAAAPRP